MGNVKYGKVVRAECMQSLSLTHSLLQLVINLLPELGKKTSLQMNERTNE